MDALAFHHGNRGLRQGAVGDGAVAVVDDQPVALITKFRAAIDDDPALDVGDRVGGVQLVGKGGRIVGHRVRYDGNRVGPLFMPDLIVDGRVQMVPVVQPGIPKAPPGPPAMLPMRRHIQRVEHLLTRQLVFVSVDNAEVRVGPLLGKIP